MQWAVGDTETYGDLGSKFKLGYIYDGRKYYFFGTPQEMKQHMLDNPMCYYFHNAKFDTAKLLYSVEEMIERQAIWHQGKMLRLPLITGGEIRDSYALLPSRLKDLGGKGDTPLELLRMPTISEVEMEYCRIDCKVLYDSLVTFFQRFGEFRRTFLPKKYKTDMIRAPKLTIGSMMMSVLEQYVDINYRTREGKYINKHVLQHNEAARNAYYGGRTENFIVGVTHKHIIDWDINSMYPYAMTQALPQPAEMRHRKFRAPKPIEWLMSYHDEGVGNYEGIALVDIIEDSDLPIIPTREGKIIWRNGRKQGWYTFPLLRYAIEQGAITGVIHEIYSTSAIFSFGKIIDYLYNLRMNGSKGDKQIYKIMMNSGYGKFGERRKMIQWRKYEELEELMSAEQEARDDHTYMWADVDRLLLQVNLGESDTTHTAYIIPAYITSHAHVLLHRYMRRIIDDGYHIYYCDTDSIFADTPPDYFPESLELGKMKKEAECSTLWVMGAKAYARRSPDGAEKVKLKGVPRCPGLMDIYTPEMLDYYYSFSSAVKSGHQVMERRELNPRKQRWEQKRVLDGPILPCDEYREAYDGGYDNFVWTRPRKQ